MTVEIDNKPLPDLELRALTVDALNSGLRCYRTDLRYIRADAERFVELWNANRVSTRATIVDADGFPHVMVVSV